MLAAKLLILLGCNFLLVSAVDYGYELENDGIIYVETESTLSTEGKFKMTPGFLLLDRKS